MVEKKRGDSPKLRQRLRTQARAVAWLGGAAILLLAGGLLWAWLGLHYSGHLALSQTASAAEVVRGFDFGPVYLERGKPGRYFISAQLPHCDAGYWQTRFEVLDQNHVSVYREDEIRFIGDFQFQPGVRDNFAKTFELDKNTGYYFFRFRALNGEFAANQAAPPVVRFTIRQGVFSGVLLWLPAALMLALGTVCAVLALALLKRLSQDLAKAENALPAAGQAKKPQALSGRAALAARRSARRLASEP